jgi:indolepyruvate ferredoxin oxidoreductase
MGDSIGANLMMVGYAWQLGLIPISETAIFQAIELNGIATDWNKDAFNWGRCFAADTSLIDKHLHLQNMVQPLQFKPTSTSEWVEKYRAELILYQDEKYAEKYRVLMTSVIDADNKLTHSKTDFSLAVAKAAYKLMAYKDEYEVARLFTTDEFKQKLQSQFEGNYKLELNLAPPIISPTDKKTGNPAKMTFGPWMLSAFHLLAKFKFLRGTPLDIFGYLPERKMERELIIDYMETVDRLLADINTDNYELAVEIAGQPMAIRGYGHVKTNNALVVKEKTSELLEQWHASQVLNVA